MILEILGRNLKVLNACHTSLIVQLIVEMMKFKQCHLIEDTSKIDSIKFKQCHFMGTS